MAAEAGVRRIVVVAVVAGGAVVLDGYVSAVELPILIVNGEGRRVPIGVGGVALVAIGGDGERHVVGVGAGVVIGQVAAFAGGRRIGIIAVLMAKGAIVLNWNMRTREREKRMVESGRNPGILRVAILAGRRQLIG